MRRVDSWRMFYLCMYVCVNEREREKERERGGGREGGKIDECLCMEARAHICA